MNDEPRDGQQRALSVVLAGGGTAGHVNPLLAIADAVREQVPGAAITVIGTKVGLEATLVPQAGYTLETIEKVPFPRKPNMAALKFPVRWKREVARVSQILEQAHADVVVGVGGYAAAPAYRAAKKAGIPIVIHEQNAKAGMANKLGARWADFVGTVYDSTGLKVGDGAQIRRVGLPLRPAIASMAARIEADRAGVRADSARQLGLDPAKPIILVTGGSLGAQSINEAVSASCAQLLACAQIVHLTGKNKEQEVRATVTRIASRQNLAGIGTEWAGKGAYHTAQYLEHIELAFACADLVICRSGAGTVSEISALGVPAIYVPFPIGNGEQKFNAAPVVEAGGGLLVDDADFTAEWVDQHIPALLADRPRLNSMRAAAWSYGVRDAAAAMAKETIRCAMEHRQGGNE